jgi:guanylate kinase
MADDPRPRFLIVSGPSCAGKSPLVDAVEDWFPDLLDGYEELTLYHSRAMRPDEEDGIDYHFRTREQIAELGDDHLVFDVRGDLMAVSLEHVEETLDECLALYEGHHDIALTLAEHERFADVDKLTVFLSPLTAEEIRAIRDGVNPPLEDVVTRMMRSRLLRRLHFQQDVWGLPELEAIERRAKDAMDALRVAHRFDAIIPNPDGEDSDHWRLHPEPLGAARVAARALAGLIRGERPPVVETWDPDLVP